MRMLCSKTCVYDHFGPALRRHRRNSINYKASSHVSDESRISIIHVQNRRQSGRICRRHEAPRLSEMPTRRVRDANSLPKGPRGNPRAPPAPPQSPRGAARANSNSNSKARPLAPRPLEGPRGLELGRAACDRHERRSWGRGVP